MNNTERELLKSVIRRVTNEYISCGISYNKNKSQYAKGQYDEIKSIYITLKSVFPFEVNMYNVWRASDGLCYVDELHNIHDYDNNIISP